MLDHLASLLTVNKTAYVQLELTTNCNLRCRYCAVSSPAWRPRQLDLATLPKLLAELHSRETKVVVINGHGETTTLPYWLEIADTILASGIGLGICSNFCRAFSAAEIETLAKFSGITISCDTADPALFRQLRGGDLRVLIHNLTRIRAKCYPDPGPDIIWSCVLCDKTVTGLPEYIKLGLTLGVRKFFLCNLGVVDLPGDRPRHLSALSPAEQLLAADALTTAHGLCASAGAIMRVDGGLDHIGVSKWE